MRALRIVREHLRAMVAETNAPLVRRVEALEIAHQEQRGLLTDAREDRDAWMEAAAALRATGADDIDGARDEIVRLKGLGSKLERVTAQRDELNGLLASAMGERDAAEARAHDLANQVTALQCAGGVDELPIQARWVSAGSEILGEANLVSGDQTVATVRMELRYWRWRVFTEPGEPGVAFITGADGERYIAKEQALEEVRVHWGPIEVVE